MSGRIHMWALMFAVLGCVWASPALAGTTISGEYLEVRSCSIYTGPCFANAEMGLTGREALMAWKIDEGTHQGVDLSGLKAVMAISAPETLGYTSDVQRSASGVNSVILADEKASPQQRQALVDFVKQRAGKLAASVQRVAFVAVDLKIDHVDMTAELKAGREVTIRTRKLAKGDCVCSNEVVYYPPLTKVDNYAAAFALEGKYSGRGLGVTWSQPNTRSAFLATFAD